MIPHPETRFARFAPQGAKKHLGRPGVFLETTQTVITIDHVRAAGLCVNGTRTWFARHDLDFRAFLRDGCDADTLLATGDAMAQRVVEHARNQSSQRERG